MSLVNIKIDGKVVKPQKSIKNPILGSKNILTNSRWEFVDLWLRREKKQEALFFWNQAKEFNKASSGLPIQSSPLLHYYSFMNATKALLSARGVAFNPYHGVSAINTGSPAKISIKNEGIIIKTAGILPSLSSYLGETETEVSHTLQEIFFNLPYIHRTYCLTYKTQTDMFIPLKTCEFVQETSTKSVYLRAALSEDFATTHVLRRLPSTFEADGELGKDKYVRSKNAITIVNASRPTTSEKLDLKNFSESIRKDVFYINGSNTLWYLKSKVTGPKIINRFPSTLTLGAMHRLSELCRYKPLELCSFLASQKNWLLSEFIQQAPEQFLDEIASEITGYQFLQPNIRLAT